MNTPESIEKSLKELIHSALPKTQIEIYYQGQVALQVFNFSDVKKWKNQLPFDGDGLVVNLFFHNAKKNNSINFANFMKFFEKDFHLVEMNKGKVKSYYKFIEDTRSINEVANEIYSIVYYTYAMEDGEPVDILVRAIQV